ncbi:MAG: hypothetical protein ACRD1Z_03310 [Vicinamibacteria bacterium]
MNCWRMSASAVVLASMSNASGDAGTQTTAAPRPACQSVWVTAPAFGKPASRARKPLNFSAAEVLDIEFQIGVRAGTSLAARPLELKLFTPKGHLYQTLAVPPASKASGAGTPKRKPRYQTLTARLPVAGTTIVNNSLYGTWKAEAYLEGERTACAKARSFVIKP